MIVVSHKDLRTENWKQKYFQSTKGRTFLLEVTKKCLKIAIVRITNAATTKPFANQDTIVSPLRQEVFQISAFASTIK